MKYISINPFTQEVLKTYEESTFPDIKAHEQAFWKWKSLPVAERGVFFSRLAALMEERREELARLITLEMGKPFSEAVLEIKKSGGAVRYYLENAAKFLEPESIATVATESYVEKDPLGLLFLIMPWNFPFWQVFRCAVPALFAGNVVLLKHAPNVPQCAEAMEKLFLDAGFPKNVFSNHFLSNENAAKLIEDPCIAGLSFTGSDTTGSYLAALAGKHLKKVVMELGGNDPFIVLEDADLGKAVLAAVRSRAINGGQACNGAKRFVLHEKIAGQFTSALISAVQTLVVGDPMDGKTSIGPMARKDLAEKVREQVNDSLKAGAIAFYGNKGVENNPHFLQPVVLTNAGPQTRCYREEVFGPVWSVVTVKDESEAIAIANDSQFGLGAALWTTDKERIKRIVPQLQAGNVFVNDIVRSDPALPFGGIKRSGFGRELSREGLMEFLNIKTVYIR